MRIDLVNKSAVYLPPLTLLSDPIGPGECATYMSDEFRFQKTLSDCPAVEAQRFTLPSDKPRESQNLPLERSLSAQGSAVEQRLLMTSSVKGFKEAFGSCSV